MKLYAIRRESGWTISEDLEAAVARSKRVGDAEMSADLRWLRSYVVEEVDGRLGTICIFEATGVEKILEHAERAGLPATAVFRIPETLLVRPDPVAAPAAAA
jgi:hypothetical protein